MTMRQGDVFWAEVGEESGERPVVILTRSGIIPYLTSVTVAPVTHTIRGIETEVIVRLKAASNRPSAVALDNLTTLEKSALREFIERLDEQTMMDVFGAIHAAFDMPF